MARFSVNAQRLEPYKAFKFRVKWDGRYVAGVAKVSAPERISPKFAGGTKYEPVTLERGLTHDPEFQKWANLAAEGSAQSVRKDVLIEVYDEAGQLALSYRVFRCWVSAFQALPDLDATANAVVIQMLRLENEGWELEGTGGLA